jgi:hypothetical protein
MGVKAATFSSAGRATQHLLPGAYSRIDYVRNNNGLVSINNAVIFGEARGGEPNKILWFGNASEAKDVLISGELLEAVRHAFSPGGDLRPQKIGACRVNPGTQSEYMDMNSTDPIISITSRIFGTASNQIRKKQEAGTVSGKKITIQYKSQTPEVYDNVGKNSFQIQYMGVGSAAVMSIDQDSLDVVVTGAEEDNLSLSFLEFPTIQEIVDFISSHPSYTCSMSTFIGSDKSAELDSVSPQDIKTASYMVTSNLQALLDVYNRSSWVSAELHSSITERILPDNNANFVYLSGAVHGAYGNPEWEESLAMAKKEDIQFISTSSESAGIHALIKQHCVDCNSETGKAERQFIVGGALGESVEQAITRAQNLNSDSGIVAYPGFKNFDLDDATKLKDYSPAYYAAKLIGAMVCLSLNEPATNKDVDVLSWEKKLSISDAEKLIAGGVCCGIINKAGRFVTARTVTTYQGSELQRCEFSMVREALFASRDLRTAVEETFIGHAMSNTMLGKVDAVVEGKLSQYFDLGIFNGNPPYWGFRKTINGDVIQIDYDANLTPPTNFVFVTSHMHVYASITGA